MEIRNRKLERYRKDKGKQSRSTAVGWREGKVCRAG